MDQNIFAVERRQSPGHNPQSPHNNLPIYGEPGKPTYQSVHASGQSIPQMGCCQEWKNLPKIVPGRGLPLVIN